MPQPLSPASSPVRPLAGPGPFAAHPAALLALLLGLACTGGCALIQPVAPWQKGKLAKPEMTFESDKLEAVFNEHVYSSKEAASGGSGVGGGGCGCN